MGGTLTLVAGDSWQLSTPLGDGTAADYEPTTCTLLGPEGPGLEGNLKTRFLGPRSDRLESTSALERAQGSSTGAVPTVC
jgi:hypothetical protein